ADGESRLFGRGQQVIESVDGSIGAAKAQNRFEAFQFAAKEAKDGLVPQLKCVIGKRMLQIAFPLLENGGLRAQPAVEYLVSPSARLPGVIESQVRIAKQRIHRDPVRIRHHYTDARLYRERIAEDLKRAIHFIKHALRHHSNVGNVAHVLTQDGELI